MSVRIRLARGGSKKRPFHKIVVADKRAPRDGRFIEQIGYYNPLVEKDNPEHFKIDADKANNIDANGDGKLTRDEFDNAACNQILTQEDEDN